MASISDNSIAKIQTAGVYHAIHSGISDYGESYQITYLIMFREVVEHFGCDYAVYLNAQVNNDQLDFLALEDLCIRFLESKYNLSTDDDHALPFQRGFCHITLNNSLQFKVGSLMEEFALGQEHRFEGVIKHNQLEMTYDLVGFDFDNKMVTTTVFRNKLFQFTPV